MGEVLKTFKGFDKDLRCRGFQYEIGKEYEELSAKACDRGFHACECPLDVLRYYPPNESRYCEVEQSGVIDLDTYDSKVASTKIKIGAEIGVPGLVKAQIEWVKAHVTTEHTDPEKATAGYRGAATAGNYGAATAGYRGAATAGNYGAATSRGSSEVGENGLAVVRGNNVKVKGGLGAVLVIAEENTNNYDIESWVAVQVDGTDVKADTWYRLKDGQLEEVKEG